MLTEERRTEIETLLTRLSGMGAQYEYTTDGVPSMSVISVFLPTANYPGSDGDAPWDDSMGEQDIEALPAVIRELLDALDEVTNG